ncbi:MAG: class I SAM-dependent methyltransferase [Candidatus Omnitrophica bacterium]|nr:class I SAM-dependent methyltransferase [Candidatus Omnitrophota bacterium]
MKTTAERSSGHDQTIKPIYYQHLSVYEYASLLARDKTVLDIGCGEGYGTALLARGAKKAVGVDYSDQAIQRCRESYLQPNIEFVRADIASFEYGASFDLVCAFQFVEHLRDPGVLLSKACRLLSPEGIFLLSTPNRRASLVKHPYHFREYTKEELRSLLEKYFKRVDIRGLEFSEKVARFREERRGESQKILRLDPLRIHMLIPLGMRRKLFDFIAARLSSKIHTRNAGLTASINTGDYRVAEAFNDTAIDLIALCSTPAS